MNVADLTGPRRTGPPSPARRPRLQRMRVANSNPRSPSSAWWSMHEFLKFATGVTTSRIKKTRERGERSSGMPVKKATSPATPVTTTSSTPYLNSSQCISRWSQRSRGRAPRRCPLDDVDVRNRASSRRMSDPPDRRDARIPDTARPRDRTGRLGSRGSEWVG